MLRGEVLIGIVLNFALIDKWDRVSIIMFPLPVRLKPFNFYNVREGVL